MPSSEAPESRRPATFDWEAVAGSSSFKALLRSKARFIIPATVFFVVYYFALPVLVGYAPEFMATPVIGPVNIAYLFALSQFFVAWLIAWLYIRAAGEFDRMGNSILRQLEPVNKSVRTEAGEQS